MSDPSRDESLHITLRGATGYIGGRLVPFPALIFGRMVRRLAERAQRPDDGEAGTGPHPALAMTLADHQRS
ncbi:MAG: hypothetical protein ACE367_07060 [Acidimicrobiales bacterium]